MTVFQEQCLLAYLGYSPGPIDGLIGPKTLAALERFKTDYGLGAEGLVGAVAGTLAKKTSDTTSDKTTDFWADIKYFTREDFRCQCGGKYCDGFYTEPQEGIARLVDAIRAELGKPCEINRAGGSGIRDPTWNRIKNGATNSLHMYGKAADLHCATATPAEMYAAAERVMGNTGGLGIYSWGIHVDTGPYSRWTG